MAEKSLNLLKLTVTDLGNLAQVTRQTAHKWVKDKDGVVQNDDGRTYSVVEVVRWMARKRQEKEGASNSLAEIKLEKEKLALIKQRHELEEYEGKIIRVDNLISEASIITNTTKSQFEKFRDKLAMGSLTGREAADAFTAICEQMGDIIGRMIDKANSKKHK